MQEQHEKLWELPAAPVGPSGSAQHRSALGCEFSYLTPHSAFCRENNFQLNASSEPIWL